jgi:ABC-type polysaccharide/polyol phosphate transport system ATPase subunit
MMDAIELDNVSIDYTVKSGTESLKKTLIKLINQVTLRKKIETNQHFNTYRALTNLSFNIKDGDRVGLVGRNGAGKSTLLRVLGKVYTPSEGNLKIHGEIASLFDINLGINPDATGIENIINLSIMRGHSHKEALSIIDDVKAFTELGDFLYRPVYSYSSGMSMKLTFAVATAFSPEILLIDEVIGVGDASFMKKARQRISNIIVQCRALVLTSHSNEIIRDFCNKVAVLDNGHLKFYGSTEEGIDYYEQEILKIKSKAKSVQIAQGTI